MANRGLAISLLSFYTQANHKGKRLSQAEVKSEVMRLRAIIQGAKVYKELLASDSLRSARLKHCARSAVPRYSEVLLCNQMGSNHQPTSRMLLEQCPLFITQIWRCAVALAVKAPSQYWLSLRLNLQQKLYA